MSVLNAGILLNGFSEHFRGTERSRNVKCLFVTPDGQSKDGNTGDDADDDKKLEHGCWMISKLFDGV